jgi:hypothetical protein
VADEHYRGKIGERLVAVEVQTRTLTTEVGKVCDHVYDMGTSIGTLTGTVEHAVETQAADHQRMQQALAQQNADRLALHQENQGAIDALHGRITGLIWWLVGAQGVFIFALLSAAGGLWLAGKR